MLNKENYVPWLSRLLHYAKSRPNGKLITNSIIKGPYVRRMIPEPADAAHAIPVPETFYEQTGDELTKAEIKLMEADDQAILIILLGLPKDIYTAVDSCETAQEIWLRVQQMMKGSEIGIQEKKAKLFSDWAPRKGVDKLHCSSDKGTYITADLHSVWQIAQPGNHVVQNAVQNPSVQNVRNQNGVIVVLGIANQNENGNVVAAWAKGNANGNNGNQIRRDATYLQTQLLIAQKEEIGIQLQDEDFDLMDATADLDEIEESDKAPVYDSDGSAEVQLHDNCYNDGIFNMFTHEGAVITKYLEPFLKHHVTSKMLVLVIYEVSSVEQGGGTVEQHPATVEETRAYQESLFHNLVAGVEKVNSVNRKLRETNADLTTELARYKNQEKAAKFIRDFQSLAKEADESLTKHKALEWEIERLLRVVVPQKVDKMNDLSNSVTSNSVAHPRKESRKMYTMRKVMPWMFRINPFKNTREEKSIPSNLNKPSVRTNPITVSQPHVITKKVVNSDSHAFSSKEYTLLLRPEGHSLGEYKE
ncbi:hypothetical protein Tco_0227311 [Tanacetum coccineum]